MLKIVSKKRIKVLGMLVFGAATVSSTQSLAAATTAVGTALRHLSAASESSSHSETQRQNPPRRAGRADHGKRAIDRSLFNTGGIDRERQSAGITRHKWRRHQCGVDGRIGEKTAAGRKF